MNLSELGWSAAFAEHLQRLYPTSRPGRISAEYRGAYGLLSEQGEVLAETDGKLRFSAGGRRDFPAVGDWVAFTLEGVGKAIIHGVLPRTSCVVRKAAGSAVEEQILAANVDWLFLVSALNGEFNPRRIERYVALARSSAARPVIVLNKADLCGDLPARLAQLLSGEASLDQAFSDIAELARGCRGSDLDVTDPAARLGRANSA